jgi:hypothetical protein
MHRSSLMLANLSCNSYVFRWPEFSRAGGFGEGLRFRGRPVSFLPTIQTELGVTTRRSFYGNASSWREHRMERSSFEPRS